MAKERVAICGFGSVKVMAARPLSAKSVSLCKRTEAKGVMRSKRGSGFVIDGTSLGNGSICSVIVPGGVGDALVESPESSPLPSEPLADALGDGVGVGVGFGVGLVVCPG